jgi:hypothetical protein
VRRHAQLGRGRAPEPRAVDCASWSAT